LGRKKPAPVEEENIDQQIVQIGAEGGEGGLVLTSSLGDEMKEEAAHAELGAEYRGLEGRNLDNVIVGLHDVD